MDFEIHINKKLHEILKKYEYFDEKTFDLTFYFFSSAFLFPCQTWNPGVKKSLSDFHTIQSSGHLCNPLTMTVSYFKRTQSPAFQFTVVASEYLPSSLLLLVHHHPEQIQQIQDNCVICAYDSGIGQGKTNL